MFLIGVGTEKVWTNYRTFPPPQIVQRQQTSKICWVVLNDCFFSSTTAPSGSGPPHLRGFYITHNDATQSVRFLWTSDKLVAETSTWQHSTPTTDRHPCPWWDSKPQYHRRAAADLRLKVPIKVRVWLASPPRGAWLGSQAREPGSDIFHHTRMSGFRLVTLHTRTSLIHWNPRPAGLASQTRTCMGTLRQWRTEGGLGGSTTPPPPRNSEAGPNSEICGK
jgi:hypothetical protein